MLLSDDLEFVCPCCKVVSKRHYAYWGTGQKSSCMNCGEDLYRTHYSINSNGRIITARWKDIPDINLLIYDKIVMDISP